MFFWAIENKKRMSNVWIFWYSQKQILIQMVLQILLANLNHMWTKASAASACILVPFERYGCPKKLL